MSSTALYQIYGSLTPAIESNAEQHGIRQQDKNALQSINVLEKERSRAQIHSESVRQHANVFESRLRILEDIRRQSVLSRRYS